MSWTHTYDWALVIDRHRTMLIGIVATLFAMAGLDFEEGGLSGHNSGKVTLPRWVYRSIMLVLRPAESAMRRLVIIAARGLRVEIRERQPKAGAGAESPSHIYGGGVRGGGRFGVGSVSPPPAHPAAPEPVLGLAGGKTRGASLASRPPPQAWEVARPSPAPGATLFIAPARPKPPAKPKPVMVVWLGRTMPGERVAELVKAGITSLKDIPPRPPAKTMAFQLFDPIKRFACFRPRGGKRKFVPAHLCPRIYTPGITEPRKLPPPPPEPQPNDELNAHRMILRLRALKGALDDVPAQARRLAIAQARNTRHNADNPAGRRRPTSPRRVGAPPGHRKRRTREVDEVLHNCDYFAHAILNEKPPDTS